MMYSEFLKYSGKSEQYISYTEYSEMIEQTYNYCELSKQQFCKMLNDVFDKLVYPAVEQAIHRLSMEEKLTMVDNLAGADRIKERIQKVYLEARKLAY